MKPVLSACVLSACLGLCPFVLAQEAAPRLKAPGEKLIADFPSPKPTKAELAVPCVDNTETTTSTEDVYRSLTSRRVYLFAIDVWGVKWFPSHVANPRYRWMGLCTDDVFVLKQFKKAIGQPMSTAWTEADVHRLIELVEQRALKLAEAGELNSWLLEPGVWR